MHTVEALKALFSMDNLYFVHTLYALSCLLLGMLGIVVRQRLAQNHEVSMFIGLAIGIGATIAVLATPYGFLAPGWCLVFVVGFLGYHRLVKYLASGHSKDPASGGGSK